MQSLQGTTKQPSARDCAWELLDVVPPIMWHIRREMRQHRGGLSMPQFRAMVMINNEPDLSLSCVAEHLALSLPTTSRIITGLVNKGFLKRQENATDRRQMSLMITSRGQSVLNTAWSAAEKSIAEQLKRFSTKEHASIMAAMKLIKQMFGSLGVRRINDE